MGIEACTELNNVHGRSSKKLMRIPHCAANRFVEKEHGRESRTHKCMGQRLKYWYQNYVCVKSWDYCIRLKEEIHNYQISICAEETTRM